MAPSSNDIRSTDETEDVLTSLQFSYPQSIEDVSFKPRTDLIPLSSPQDWRDEILYSIMIDRFNRGKGAVHPLGNPASPCTLHGGNIRGVHEKLDYIQDLGVTAIWLSPVKLNPQRPEFYHGYAPRNFLDVDPSKGTMQDLRDLVNDCHRRNIRVIFDYVANHTCHAFDYDDDTLFVPYPNPPKKILRWVEQIIPDELMHEDHFYRRGDIFDWNCREQFVSGDFISYQHGHSYNSLNLARRETQEILIKIALFWIRETGIDGFRCDATRHIEPAFWRRFNHTVRQYAASLGKHNFLFIGEAFHTDVKQLGMYLTPLWGSFDSVFEFEDHFSIVGFLRAERHPEQLRRAIENSENVVNPLKGFFCKMLDGHDLKRFLREQDDQHSCLLLGYTYLFTTAGLPILFYGTEQGLCDGDAPAGKGGLDVCRTDMFDSGKYRSPGQPAHCFNTESFGYKTVQRLADIRSRYPALRRGSMHVRSTDQGAFIFSRLYYEQEIVVILNPTEYQLRFDNVWVHHDNNDATVGRMLVDLLDPTYHTFTRAGTSGGTVVNLNVPPRAPRILVSVQSPSS